MYAQKQRPMLTLHFLQCKQLIGAQKELDQALKEHSANFEVKNFAKHFKIVSQEAREKATMLLMKKNYSEASQLLNDTIEISPEDPSLVLNRGICFRNMSNFPASVKDFLVALKLKKGNYPEAEQELSNTLMEIGRKFKKFVDAFLKFILQTCLFKIEKKTLQSH